MRVNFRQGILSTQSGGFLSYNTTGNVDLVATSRSVSVLIAHKDTNYLHVDDATVTDAWVGTFESGTDYWLYWDFDNANFRRTFGWTTVKPVAQPTQPPEPEIGLHWFDTTNDVHYEYLEQGFVKVHRVFAARLNTEQFYSMSQLAPLFTGTQIGDTSSNLVGSVLYSENGKLIIRDDGTFFTTEDQFYTNQSQVTGIRLESNVTRGTLKDSSIAKYQVVAFDLDGQLEAAQYNDVDSKVVAIVTEDLLINEVGNVILQGKITNSDWDWSDFPSGTKLWVSNGELIPTDPYVSDPATYPKAQVPVAKILSSDTIIFEQGLGGVGPAGPKGSIDDLPPASSVKLGTVFLSVPPVNDSIPKVVGDNDSRLLNAPFAQANHAHPASEISVTPTGDITSTQLQLVLTELDTEKFSKSGGVVTGQTTFNDALILSSSPIDALQAANKKYVDDADDLKLDLSGGTLTGNIIIEKDASATFVVDSTVSGSSAINFKRSGIQESFLSSAATHLLARRIHATGGTNTDLSLYDDFIISNKEVRGVLTSASSANASFVTKSYLTNYADVSHNHTLSDITDYDPTIFATAAQGTNADSALQNISSQVLADLSNVDSLAPTDLQVLTFNASSNKWEPADSTGASGGSSTDHGTLTGLGDDDHSHYHNDTRGDIRYYTKTLADNLFDDKFDNAGGTITGDTTLKDSQPLFNIDITGPNGFINFQDDGTDKANMGYVIASDTITMGLIGSTNIQIKQTGAVFNKVVTSAPTPTANTHLTNKAYVDGEVNTKLDEADLASLTTTNIQISKSNAQIIANSTSGAGSFLIKESGTTRSSMFFNPTNNILTFLNNENGAQLNFRSTYVDFNKAVRTSIQTTTGSNDGTLTTNKYVKEQLDLKFDKTGGTITSNVAITNGTNANISIDSLTSGDSFLAFRRAGVQEASVISTSTRILLRRTKNGGTDTDIELFNDEAAVNKKMRGVSTTAANGPTTFTTKDWVVNVTENQDISGEKTFTANNLILAPTANANATFEINTANDANEAEIFLTRNDKKKGHLYSNSSQTGLRNYNGSSTSVFTESEIILFNNNITFRTNNNVVHTDLNVSGDINKLSIISRANARTELELFSAAGQAARIGCADNMITSYTMLLPKERPVAGKTAMEIESITGEVVQMKWV